MFPKRWNRFYLDKLRRSGNRAVSAAAAAAADTEYTEDVTTIQTTGISPTDDTGKHADVIPGQTDIIHQSDSTVPRDNIRQTTATSEVLSTMSIENMSHPPLQAEESFDIEESNQSLTAEPSYDEVDQFQSKEEPCTDTHHTLHDDDIDTTGVVTELLRSSMENLFFRSHSLENLSLETVSLGSFSLGSFVSGTVTLGKTSVGYISLGYLTVGSHTILMTTAHYIKKDDRTICFNASCQRKFTLRMRPRHCRRCGEVFCIKCLRYQRRLNLLAHPDPEGKPRKVCKRCYDEDAFTIGVTNSLTVEFLDVRSKEKDKRKKLRRETSLTDSFWRDDLALETECRRLLEGFRRTVGTSASQAAISNMRSKVDTPSWQKSSYWAVEKAAERCRSCKGGLGLRKRRRSCKVCGLTLCKKCSLKDLLVYLSDDRDLRAPPVPRISIINCKGSPEQEPSVSLLLHVCSDCKTEIESRQKVDLDWFLTRQGLLEQLKTMETSLSDVECTLSKALTEIEMMLDHYETQERGQQIPRRNPKKEKREKKEMSFKSLPLAAFKPSKDDCDRLSQLKDTASQMIHEEELSFYRLKTYKPLCESSTQCALLRNFTQCKYDFVMDKKSTYRQLVRRWEALPTEDLQSR